MKKQKKPIIYLKPEQYKIYKEYKIITVLQEICGILIAISFVYGPAACLFGFDNFSLPIGIFIFIVGLLLLVIFIENFWIVFLLEDKLNQMKQRHKKLLNAWLISNPNLVVKEEKK